MSMGAFVTVTGYGPERSFMRETLLGQGAFATEAAFGAPEYAWEKLPPAELGG